MGPINMFPVSSDQMPKPKHTAEPWPDWDGVHPKDVQIPIADYRRARECVNALAGIADPVATLKLAREALRIVEQALRELGGAR